MRRALWVMVAVIAAAACGCASQQKHADSLTRGLRSYHEGLRWRAFEKSAIFVPAAERAGFLDAHDAIREDLRIDEYSIRRVIYGPKTETADVRVEYAWHLDSRGIVEKTVVAQKWELRGESWLLIDEVRVRGEPMPTIPEPAAEPGTEPAADPGNAPAVEPATEPAVEPGTAPAVEPATGAGAALK
ncbi:MAG TPA: hypothetical protein VFG83_15550 [Kofleriaceae bacterium]|nr:hypothetical protein [Kofleriaceae bacterium]